MFGFIKTHKVLEIIHQRLKMNAENNYRDATLQDLKELEDSFQKLKEINKLSKRQKEYYSSIIIRYKEEFEYSCAAEPPVRCGESHQSGL